MAGDTVLLRREIRAMNSDIELVCCGPAAARRLDRAGRWLGAYEERYSRFRVLSEVSRLNAAAGRPFRASPGLLRLLTLALDLARRSGGLFDPTVLGSLEAAGYDRSFEKLTPDTQTAPRRRRNVSWRDVSLDVAARTVLLPAGAGIDLGGIGKGWAVDRLSAILGSPSLVNGGGDVFAAGRPPGEDAWRVGVAGPFHPDDDLVALSVVDKGVATSSSLRRRWRAAGLLRHHLIDPRTGRPSESDAVQVTAVAQTATLADFHAKVALLHGASGAVEYIDAEPGVEGIVVRRDGALSRTAGIDAYSPT